MEAPHLEWSAAVVRDGTLTVELVGDRPRGWKATFLRTAKLLGGGGWGEVKVKGPKVTVTGVPDGDEEELRFFLESVVQQANATHVQDEDDEDDDAEDEADEGDDADGGDDPDARMTERFRAFGAT
jgi:hypothetical protein